MTCYIDSGAGERVRGGRLGDGNCESTGEKSGILFGGLGGFAPRKNLRNFEIVFYCVTTDELSS